MKICSQCGSTEFYDFNGLRCKGCGDKPRQRERKAETARYRRRRRPQHNAECARYEAAKLNATVLWSDSKAIDEFYKLAALKSVATGFKWQVDHIVPLQSKLVCGLHVETNLAVIPAKVNMSKCNRSWPDMP